MEIKLKKIHDYLWEIQKEATMKVPGRIYTEEKNLAELRRDRSLKQLANVAHLPGIQKYSIAMPDIHLGYGFPIGGIAAMDTESGVISPGGVGYDINCGVRLLSTSLEANDVMPKLDDLLTDLFNSIPCGMGIPGKIKLSRNDYKDLIAGGRDIYKELRNQGVIINARGKRTVMEEIPEAYKNAEEVCDIVQNSSIADKVVKLKPIGVLKG